MWATAMVATATVVRGHSGLRLASLRNRPRLCGCGIRLLDVLARLWKTVESSRRNVEVVAELLFDTFVPSAPLSRGHEGPELGVQIHSAFFALAPVGLAIGSSHARKIQHALPTLTTAFRAHEINRSPSIGGLD